MEEKGKSWQEREHPLQTGTELSPHGKNSLGEYFGTLWRPSVCVPASQDPARGGAAPLQPQATCSSWWLGHGRGR